MEEYKDLNLNEETIVESLEVQEEMVKNNPLQIKDEEVWEYKVEGLPAPRINKPVKNKLLKQIVFVLVILVAIGLAIYFSVAAVQKDTFEFKELDYGIELSKFNNTGYVKELSLDYYMEIKYLEGDSNPETNFYFVKDETKPITAIREYAFNCDEKLEVVYLGAEIKEIDGKSFYTCNALERIEVDENNPYFCDIDGVLYNKELTEVICYPIKHSSYIARTKGYDENADANSESYVNDVLTYTIPSSVTKIGKLAFNYTDLKIVYLPEGLKKMETMSFFRATQLDYVYSYRSDGSLYNSLPEGLEYLGSDAFSYCQELDYVYIPASVSYIGHHAFWDTVYKEKGELKGVTEVNVAREKKDFKKNVDCGDQWRPKYDYLLFKKNVEVNYGAIRKAN